MTREHFDINEAIEEVVALTHAAAQRSRVLVRTRLNGNLPPILGDRVQLQQVMLNLLVNAMEAMNGMEEGQRELLVSTNKITDMKGPAGATGSSADESSYVSVAVRDSGPGLLSSSLPQLFT